ncbi:hypothetical protein SAMN05421825_2118 [Epilithonimonas hungarica]|uniref:YhhN-like protein n=1 Tax=Epilithonimonas hungarica TaxID=454006 RepID=A0A1G7NZ50_9FLAO|nr:hypothetical protein SAMN05421825_2118 [Epilithonimonas hungarica]
MEKIFEICATLADIFLGITLIIAIIKLKFFTKNERWYIYYAFFVFCIEIIMFFKIKQTHTHLYPIYIAGEFFLLSGTFLKKLSFSRYYFIPIILLSLVFLTASQIFPYYENDYSKAISNLIIICLIAYSLIQEIRHSTKSQFLFLDGMLFLYYTVSIFIFMLQHQVLRFDHESFFIIWAINNILLVILYLTFLYTFLKLKK